MKRAFAVFGIFLLGGFVALALSDFHGDFYFMIQLLPDTELYKAELELTATIAGWDITSESKLYSDGWRYQNFYFEGMLGPFETEGKIYFHAQDVRYQKFWVNFEVPLSGEGNYLRLSVNHWASPDDWFGADYSLFGRWPCAVWWEELLPWDEKDDIYEGETFCVQGPVVSYYYRGGNWVTLNVGADYPDPRFLVYFTGEAFDAMVAKYGPNFWEDLVGKSICVCGEITEYESPRGVLNPEIAYYDPEDIEDFKVGPCCVEPTAGLGPLMIYRAKAKLSPITLIVDFLDCCEGVAFRKLDLGLSDMTLCCGITWDADLSFTKCGFEKISFAFENFIFLCCDITFDVEVTFTVDSKIVAIEPEWTSFATGCLEVYGDVQWSDHILGGFELYGFSIECSLDSVTLRAITAFDPDKVEELTDITFYTNEFEYLGIEYTGAGCCGGELSFTSGFWFGTAGTLFDLQRARFELEIPIYDGFTAIVKGQWDLSVPELDWFDIGWKIEF